MPRSTIKKRSTRKKTVKIKRKKKRLRDSDRASHAFGYSVAFVLLMSAIAAWYTLSEHETTVRQLLYVVLEASKEFLSSVAAFVKALLID